MELYMLNRQHGRMILESVENGPLLWPTVEEDGVTWLTLNCQQQKPFKPIVTLRQQISFFKDFLWRFMHWRGNASCTMCLISLHIGREKLFVNTKFLNTLPSKWSKFVTDVKLVRDLHTINVDQLHAYLGQHEYHANEFRLTHERTTDPLALVAQHQMHNSTYQQHQPSYHQHQFQQQASTYQSSPYATSYHTSQYASQAPSSLNLSISYPPNDIQSFVNHNAYIASSSIPQIEYALTVHQHSELSSPETGLVVPVFQKGDDPIDAINHMMSDLTAVVTSRYLTTNNQLRTSSNPWQQATINNGRVTIQPIQGRQNFVTAGSSKPYASGSAGASDCPNGKLAHYGYYNLAEALGFQNPCYLKRAQQLKPKLYDGSVTEKSDAIVVHDSKETLLLAEESLQPEEPNLSASTTIVEVPKELPKVSLAVEQHSVEKNKFQNKMKNVLMENDRLLTQALSVDIVNIVVHDNVKSACMNVDVYERCVTTESELKKDFIKKDCYDTLFQNAPTFPELFEINDSKAQAQAKDTVILKLKEKLHSLTGDVNERKVKRELEEIETLNIELDHKVTKLVAENEHLKQNYKQLYDSIKSSRVRSKEQCDDLINKVNLKSAEVFDLNASLQEKVLVITTLKETLSKLKSKAVVTEAVSLHPLGPKLLKIDVTPLAPKLHKNRTVHTDYIRHTQEEAATLRKYIKSKFVTKPVKRKFWQPTGKLFTTIGHRWKPTGRTFSLVGNVCPLTRIATTTIVRPREPIPIASNTDKPVITLVYSRKSKAAKKVPVSNSMINKSLVVQIVLWYLDFGCSKHMTGDCTQLIKFVQKFLGMVKFGNNHMAKIMGYGDYHIWNVTISWVYYVEGLGHNLFFVGQFYDSDLEVAFRQHTRFIRNLDGVDMLTGSQGNNLYTLSLQDMMASSPICLLSKESKTKSWLWHRRLSHLNFGAINHLARQGLVRGLLKLKFEKDHLCLACVIGKSTKKTHKPKSEDTNQEKLYLLHMDLGGPMRVESVNGKKYILVIIDDFSQFTWVKFLRSKDEALDFIIKFLKMIQVLLKVPVRRIRTDNGTEFVNQTLRDYYKEVDISHETSVACSLQQNGVVERRNRALIEAARTMNLCSSSIASMGRGCGNRAFYLKSIHHSPSTWKDTI
nr:retrovirus-related Pol polyprotein from transposon TNT 1-94 [Tanacetum cinerariifolium]